MVVYSRCEEVLIHYLLSGESVEAQIAIREARAARIGRMPKCEIGSGVGINCDSPAGEIAGAGIHGGYSRDGSNSFGLPNRLKISEEECAVFYDWSADRSPKLISLERWNWDRGIIEIILRVELAVAQKLIQVPVNRIRSGAGNCVHDAAGGLAVFGGVVAGDDGEFLNCVDTEASAQDTSWGTIRIVIQAHAVETIIVLLWACTRDCQLLPKAAIAAVSARREIRLRVDCAHTGLKLCQVRPAAAVERQFTNCRSIYDRADVRTSGLHRWDFTLHAHGFINGTDSQSFVQR